ncbi:MAG: leucine-rich repeat domain-containing protein [Clostridia bacterium]|nr:leucine-rich repeat domain-containing protein [Clostridia bacterium]
MGKLSRSIVSMLLAAALIVPQGGVFASDIGEANSQATENTPSVELYTTSATATAVASGTFGTALSWAVYDSGELYISGTGAMPDYSWSTPAPWYTYRNEITSVVVASGVTGIGERAFYNLANLVSAQLSDTVTSIGNRAFWWCESLTTVQLGNSVASIGYNAFDTCPALTTINIPDSVAFIGHNAFSGCTSLPDLDIPETVSYVGGVAFYECDTITSANVPDSSTAIGGLSYYGCDNLTTVSIPESITSIGIWAFRHCADLTSVTVPESVDEIGAYAFAYCDNLASATIYSRDAEFGADVFEGVASGFTVYAYLGSTAHAYAVKNGHNFVPLTGTGAISASGECGDGLMWTLNDLGELVITGAGDMTVWAKASDAPWHAYRAYITSVTVEAGVATISNYSFTDFSAVTKLTVKSRNLTFASAAIGGSAAAPTVYGYTGTTAETFASSKGYTFVALEDRPIIASGECGENLGWILYEDGILEINGIGAMYDYTSSSPATWDTHRASITKVVLNSGVTSIGNYAFRRCTALADVEFAATVTSIGDSAFYWCTALESMNIPASVTTIGDNAFSGCSGLTELKLNEGLVSIGAGAFAYCEQITSVNIPASVTTIGDTAFASCTALTGFTVDAASESFTVDAYGALYNKEMTTLIQYPVASTRTAYTAPSTVTAIAGSAFEGNQALRIVTLGDNLLTVGDSAFAYCPSLEKVTVNARNTGFGLGVFDGAAENFVIYGHSGSTAQTYASENSYTFVSFTDRTVVASGACGAAANWTLYEDGELDITGTGAMYNYTGSSTAPWYSYRDQITSVTVNAGITTIGNYAFSNCAALAEVFIGDDVTSIGSYAFRRCTALTAIDIPDSVATIGASAFYWCTALSDLKLSAGLTTIAGNTFSGCKELTTVTIPEGVETIASSAFGYCDTLAEVYISSTVTTIEDGAFAGCPALTKFVVDGDNADYTSDADGVLFTADMTKLVQYPAGSAATSYDVPETVVTIAASAFESAANLKSVYMGESVTEIGDMAFASCTSLAKVTVEAMFASFGFVVFDGTPSSFTIYGYNDSTAQSYASENGHRFSIIVIRNVVASGDCGTAATWTLYDDGTLEIEGSGAMYDWTASNAAPWNSYAADIAAVVIGDGITTIGNYAFNNCTALVDVTFGADVAVIGDSAFSNCTMLMVLSIGSGVETVGESAFYGCTALEFVELPNGVTTISDSAFDGCSLLDSIDIPASVTTIGANVFAGCVRLSSINVDADNTAYSSDDGVLLDKNAATLICFPANSSITEYTVPETVTAISDGAFASASKLTKVVVESTDVVYGFVVFDGASADLELHGYNGSTTEAYANDNSITFVSLDAPIVYVAKIGETSYATLEEALAASGNITLLADITDEVTVTKEVSIIKNGFTAVIVAGTGYELIESDEAYNVYTAITKKFDLSGVTMTLGASLSLDFAINTANLTGTDNYAKMTIVHADGSPSDTIIVPQSEWTVFSGKIYTAKFTGMAAKQMNDVVTAVVYNAKGQIVSNTKSDSIETYAVRMLNGSAANNAKLRSVYVDMLNYGAAAQTQFGYDEENLANRNLTAAHQAWATTAVETSNDRVSGTGYAGTTLTLESAIQLDFVFNNSTVGSTYTNLYAIATYTDHYGNAKEIRIEGSDFIKYSSKHCQISVTGMAVADYEALVTCTVYKADGTKITSAADGIGSYANRNSASLGATVDTIVKFGASSYNYFH